MKGAKSAKIRKLSFTRIGMESTHGQRTKSIPITGLSLFIAEKKPELESSDLHLTKMEIFKSLHDQWATLDQDVKQSYERRADYSRRTEARRKCFERRKEKTPNRSKSTISAYSIFLTKRQEELKKSNPELTLSERTRMIAKEWSETPKNDRVPYVNMAKRETRKMRKVNWDEDLGSTESTDDSESD